jgi:hypothetical protein
MSKNATKRFDPLQDQKSTKPIYVSNHLKKQISPDKNSYAKLWGQILLSGSLIVTEFAHWIRDDCLDIFHRLKRLLNHLVNPRERFARLYRLVIGKIPPEPLENG